MSTCRWRGDVSSEIRPQHIAAQEKPGAVEHPSYTYCHARLSLDQQSNAASLAVELCRWLDANAWYEKGLEPTRHWLCFLVHTPLHCLCNRLQHLLVHKEGPHHDVPSLISIDDNLYVVRRLRSKIRRMVTDFSFFSLRAYLCSGIRDT